MDEITDRKFLKFIGFDECEIKIVQKNIKPYIKWERVRVDIDTIFTLGSVVHTILSVVYLIF